MLRFKGSCTIHPKTLNNIHMLKLLTVIQEEAPDKYVPVVTSAFDFVDGRVTNSLHPKGLAVDLRIKDVPGMPDERVLLNHWIRRMRDRLGIDYDIVLKENHVHCEYDRKNLNR